MAPSIPSTMEALVVQDDKTVGVEELPIPDLQDNEILVKVEAIAQNPTDWKHVEFVSEPGTIVGCDFSGTVVRLGKATKPGVQIGDQVSGFVQGGYFKDRGAFAKYVKTESELVSVMPKGAISHEEACTTGCGLWTAAQAFYNPGRLGLVEPPAKVSSETWVFVYGGSTSVGQFAVQLAHLSGYKVVTTASPHNHAFVKSLGADEVFDYKSPDVVSQIKRVTDDSLHLAFDTHAKDGSQCLSISALGPGPGKLVVIHIPDEEAKKLRPDVEVQHDMLIYNPTDEPIMLDSECSVSEEDRAHMAHFLSKLGGLVHDGCVKPNPVKLWEGGFEGVKDGFQYMKDGKVSGEKIVYSL